MVEYLVNPPARALLEQLIARMGITPRELLREKGTPFHELGLDDPALNDAALIDAMLAEPILINRPIVVSPKGVRLCRPAEVVLDLLPAQRGAFAKEDGESVVDEQGQPVAAYCTRTTRRAYAARRSRSSPPIPLLRQQGGRLIHVAL